MPSSIVTSFHAPPDEAPLIDNSWWHATGRTSPGLHESDACHSSIARTPIVAIQATFTCRKRRNAKAGTMLHHIVTNYSPSVGTVDHTLPRGTVRSRSRLPEAAQCGL